MYWQIKGILWLTGILISLSLSAEPGDRQQPLHLEADQVVIDEKQGTSVFSGQVQLKQGSLLMRADKIIVRQDEQGFQTGTLFGEPASFRQKREGVDEYIEGYGRRIVYDARQQQLDFYGQARIQRARDQIKGEHIRYNAVTEVFQVDSRPASDEMPKGRVRAVLQPASSSPDHAPAPASPLSIQRSESLSEPLMESQQ